MFTDVAAPGGSIPEWWKGSEILFRRLGCGGTGIRILFFGD